MMLNRAPFELRNVLLLADGDLSTFGAKTAVCYLRYRGDAVTAVLDRATAGRRVPGVLGFGPDVPIVATVGEAAALGAETAVIGIAPRGGQLGAALREQVLECIGAGLDVVAGLHTLLGDDEEIRTAARASGSRLWDVRRVPESSAIGTGRGCTTGARTVLTVGSDCNVGKMTTTVELYDEAVRRGVSVAWAATGQTGILLRGRGVAVDRVIVDFIGGVAETLVNEEGRDHDLVIVEGQGSLVHPGFAGVTLGLMLGVAPDCMVMVHAAGRERVGDSDVVMPPLADLVALHEAVMAPHKRSPVVALAVNTAGLDAAQARAAVARAADDTGLVAADPIRNGAAAIMDAVSDYLESQKENR